MSRVRALVAAAFVIGGAGFGLWRLSPTEAHDRISTNITWEREISAIVERRCLSCHTGGGFAGFSFGTYDEARPWAVAIKEEVLAGNMPPWGAAPGIGQFANDRRLTRHEMELIAAWVDGGAPLSLPNATSPNSTTPNSQVEKGSAQTPLGVEESRSGNLPAQGTVVPLANAIIERATERSTSVTLQVPAGFVLTGWSFEPGTPALIEWAELEFGVQRLGTWTPGETSIDFPSDAGVPLRTSSTFTARIAYRAPADRSVDYSRLRLWMSTDGRAKTIREGTVMRSWQPPTPVTIFGVRPARDEGEVTVVARFADGRVEPLGVFAPPLRAPHPTYRLARPLELPAGARLDTTGPIRLLYTTGATRTVKTNVRTRSSR